MCVYLSKQVAFVVKFCIEFSQCSIDYESRINQYHIKLHILSLTAKSIQIVVKQNEHIFMLNQSIQLIACLFFSRNIYYFRRRRRQRWRRQQKTISLLTVFITTYKSVITMMMTIIARQLLHSIHRYLSLLQR